MNGKAVLLAAAFVSLAFCIPEPNAQDGRRTLDVEAIDGRDNLTVIAPGAEELRRAEDRIGFAADWALEANLQDRFTRGTEAWHALVVGHQAELERIQERNRTGEALRAWAQWFELGGQLMAFARVINTAGAPSVPSRAAGAFELCYSGLCERLPIELLLENALPAGATDSESFQFDEVRGQLLQTLPSLGPVRCDMVGEQCWVPGESEAAAGRHPASLALLAHAGRIAARMSRGAVYSGQQALLAANRHWVQWRNIYSHWRKHGEKFPGNPTILRYAEEMTRFLKTPPSGTRMALRHNGDRMLYHAPSDRFGVIGQNGFLKTYFRPGRGVVQDGLRYWQGQLRRWSATEEIVR